MKAVQIMYLYNVTCHFCRRTRSKVEAELEENRREIDSLKEKCAKARDETGKKEEELILLNAVMKQKEVALQEAQEVCFDTST